MEDITAEGQGWSFSKGVGPGLPCVFSLDVDGKGFKAVWTRLMGWMDYIYSITKLHKNWVGLCH